MKKIICGLIIFAININMLFSGSLVYATEEESQLIIENTESTEKTESTENTEIAGEPEGIENTENIESVENSETTENTESAESTVKTESTEGAGTPENTESTESTENTENTECTENTEEAEETEEEVYVPRAASKIKTTSTSVTKVKIAWENDTAEGYSYKVYVLKANGKYKYLGSTTKKYYYATVEKNKTYTFKVHTCFNNKKLSKDGLVIKFYNKEYVSITTQNYTYSAMKSDINGLLKKYSEYLSYSVVGKTVEGRNIYDIVLGNPKASKCILVVSGMHAREYITSLTCMKQIEYYLLNYNKTIDGVKPANVFKNCCVHYVVMANPDGITLEQSKTSMKSWKANARGVDINRNFPYEFVKTGSKAKGTYTGSSAASEKETKAIMAVTKKLMDKFSTKLIIINYHAQGQVLFWDYLGTDSRIAKINNKMTSVAKKTTGYSKIASDGKTSNGNYREYVMYVLGIPSITVEIGQGGCPVNKKYYKLTFEKNKFLILREAQIL